MNAHEGAPGRVESAAVSWAQVALARRLGLVTLSALLLVMVAPRALEQIYVPLAGVVSGLLGLGALVAGIVSFVVWFHRSVRPGALEIGEGSVVVRHGTTTRRIDRARIASAYVCPRFRRGVFVPTVELELVNGDLVSIEAVSDEVAQRAVVQLRFGAGEQRTHLELGSPSRRLIHLPLGLAAYYMGVVATIFPLVLFGATASSSIVVGLIAGLVTVGGYRFLRALARPPELTIGDDGVLYRAGLTKRFVPRSAITGVEQTAVGAPLTIQAGPATIIVEGAALDLERRAAATRALRERLGAGLNAGGGARAFGRGGRTLSAWREHLKTQIGAAAYREAASPTDVAAAVLTSAHATAEERVGAALALRIAGEPPRRVRVAASSAADEHLRVALETVAETEDDLVLDRALRKLR